MFRVTYLLLLFLLTYHQLVAQATDPPGIVLRDDAPSCVDGCSKRTLFSIIWGCFSTTIICAWAAIHPNIPPHEGPVKSTLRRLELMLWTIVAPEILPAWALNQRLAAVTVRDVYNQAKGYNAEKCGIWKTLKGWFSLYEITESANPAWTLKHGYFLIMGGFHLVERADSHPEANSRSLTTTPVMEQGTHRIETTDRERGSASHQQAEAGRVTLLTLEMLKELVKDPEFEIRITEDTIDRTAKGDSLSKFILILQSSWFIVQCLARWIQGLSLTQLELTTLALASLNGITFGLWWDKPLGTQTVVSVQMKRMLTDAERDVTHQRGHSKRSELIPFGRGIVRDALKTIRDIVLFRSKTNIFVGWLFGLPFAILDILFFPFLVFPLVFVYTILDLLDGSTSFPAGATHVPTFYVPKHRYSNTFKFHIVILLMFDTMFGVIHCAGWYLPFPTHLEEDFWRIASLAVAIIPLLIAAVVILLKYFPIAGSSDLALLLFAFYMLLYASARILLLVLALVLLKNPSPGALMAVEWTKFYPHFL